jgi:cyclic-di-AMP phosphodiesterase PgpH
MTWNGPPWLQRYLALGIAVVVVPLFLGISAFLQDTPIRVDEPSPRTVVAPNSFRVPDPDATDRARREAANAVQPVVVQDEQAVAQIVQEVRDLFARVKAAREPDDEGRTPSEAEQLEALQGRLPMLDELGVRTLVGLSDDQLQQTASETEQIARYFARQRIREEDLQPTLDEQLPSEVAVRSFPPQVDDLVVQPVIREVVRPTVRVDEEATAAARERAADDVAPVVRTYTEGRVIVAAGEVVDEVQLAALRERGLEGAEPFRALARAFALALAVTIAVSLYLRTYRQKIWTGARRLLLLSTLFALLAAAVEAVVVLAPAGGWLFVMPVGAIAMLATILFDPPIGVLVTIPTTLVVAFTTPGDPAVAAFAALAALVSVPLVSRLSARGDLRRAAWQSTLGYLALALVVSLIFPASYHLPTVLLAAALNGIITAMIVNGSLPFLESVFGVLTATSLLDLADRNHPLLRELEQKALGSYNHSIMVSTLVERAARAIGSDGLLGSVAALYHDIGKVRRPYFFVENQFGMANPHDELTPEQSAVIIQEHVTDGLEMARTHRLPPEVVEGIATHHGTTLVSYFHRQALSAAEDPSTVSEAHYRYKGRKPSTKEMAILMLADCCEGASRAAALHNRNLTKDDLEGIVRSLVAERVEDGQLDESSLTFHELKLVQESFIETLVGVYHPRIAYPDRPAKPVEAATPSSDGARSGAGAPAEADGHQVGQPARAES